LVKDRGGGWETRGHCRTSGYKTLQTPGKKKKLKIKRGQGHQEKSENSKKSSMGGVEQRKAKRPADWCPLGGNSKRLGPKRKRNATKENRTRVKFKKRIRRGVGHIRKEADERLTS